MKLLTMGNASPKLIKSDNSGKGYLSAIMYLAPHKLSGHNVCPNASPGCIAACLFTAGRGVYDNVQTARINRTKFFYDDRAAFIEQLQTEIIAFNKKVKRKGLMAAIRLNGTSDIPWERIAPQFFTQFADVEFYDYTKSTKRMLSFLRGEFPKNYHLTFSRSEINDADCETVLRAGGNVAVVFKSKQLPKTWKRFKVRNADETDLRFLDTRGVQGLYAKGRARRDASGFVVEA